MSRTPNAVALDLRRAASGLVPEHESRLMREAADMIDRQQDELQARNGLRRCPLCGEHEGKGSNLGLCGICARGEYGG